MPVNSLVPELRLALREPVHLLRLVHHVLPVDVLRVRAKVRDARPAHRPEGVHVRRVCLLRLGEAVRSHDDRPREVLELHRLLVPRAAEVSREVLESLELRVSVPREHLAVRVHLDAEGLAGLEEAFHDMEVMPRDQHALAGERRHRHLRRLGLAEGGVGLVEHLHRPEVRLAAAKVHLESLAEVVAIRGCEERERLVHERVHPRVLLAHHQRVVCVRAQALEAVHEHLAEGRGVLVEGREALRQDRDRRELRGGHADCERLELVDGRGASRDVLGEPLGVVVHVGERREHALEREVVDVGGDLLAGLAERVCVVAHFRRDLHHLVLHVRHLRRLVAVPDRRAAARRVLRALVAEHLALVHVELLTEGGSVLFATPSKHMSCGLLLRDRGGAERHAPDERGPLAQRARCRSGSLHRVCGEGFRLSLACNQQRIR
mmetsp:Transcript_20648/g.47826  ORF Transcript_20648/g.47826 Transcript_20648/m.47826 type:complete len:434 (+) Transcript_20648:689-1990(+)